MTAASATAGWAAGRLQLGRGDLVALVLDQLLQPVDDREVAVVVGIRRVAGVQPALGVDRCGGRLGLVEIALHHLRAAHPELARLARSEFGAGCRIDDFALRVGNSGRLTDLAIIGISWRQVGRPGCLGQAVALLDAAAEALGAGARDVLRLTARHPRHDHSLSRERSYSSTIGCFARARTIGGTRWAQVTRYVWRASGTKPVRSGAE